MPIAIGMSIFLSAIDLPQTVFYSQKNFSVFSISIAILITAILFAIPYIHKSQYTAKEIIVFACLFIYLYDFEQPTSLWGLGSISLLVIYVMIRSTKKYNFTIIIIYGILTILWLNTYGYLQYMQWLPTHSELYTISGPYHNPAVLSAIIALLVGVAINILIYCPNAKQRTWIKYSLYFSIAYSLPLLALSTARSAWIACIVSILYGIYYKYNFIITPKVRFLYACIILFTIAIFTLCSYSIKPDSAKGRLLIWKISCKMIKDKPLSGFGKGGFAGNYLYYQADYMKSSATEKEKTLAGNTHLAFNEPLRITIEYGIVSTIVYLVFIITFLFFQSPENHIKTISRSVLAGIVSWGFFSYPNQAFPILLLGTLSIAYGLNDKKDKPHEISVFNLSPRIVSVSVCFIAVLTGIKLYDKWRAYSDMQSYLYYYKTKSINENTEIPEHIKQEMDKDYNFAYFCCLKSFRENNNTTFLESFQYLRNHFPTPAIWVMYGDYNKEQGYYKVAETAYQLASNMVPTLQIPRSRLAILYKDIGKDKKALEIVNQILTEKVKVYSFDTFTLHRKLKNMFKEQLNNDLNITY